MPIKGQSEKRRLPRLGKIRLGYKDETKRGAPVATDYFVCPPEVQAVYGEKPRELKIRFPVNDTEIVFPQYYKCYGKSGLKCYGDGEQAQERGPNGEWNARPCTPDICQSCSPVGILNVILDGVPGFGVWQIWTRSYNTMLNINSSLEMIRAVTGGRFAWIPLKLSLDPHIGTVIKDGKAFQKEVYVLNIQIDTTMDAFWNEYSKEANHKRALANPGYAALTQTAQQLMQVTATKCAQDIAYEIEPVPDDEVFDAEFEEPMKPVEQLICFECGDPIKEDERDYSVKRYGRPLCRRCQKKEAV